MTDAMKALAGLVTAIVALVTLLITLGVVNPNTTPTTSPTGAGGGGETVAFTERLRPDTRLIPGQQVVSMNGTYHLRLQDDGNLVLSSDTRGRLWASGTDGRGVDEAVMQADGNFVLYAKRVPIWSTDTPEHPGSALVVQDDGNLVLYDTAVAPLWASQTAR